MKPLEEMEDDEMITAYVSPPSVPPIASSLTCPPCHGNCDQGRTCPNRKVIEAYRDALRTMGIDPDKVAASVTEGLKRSPYSGPIEPGMRFVWEPDLPHARCNIVVTRAVRNERAIYSRRLDHGFAQTGSECWNDESRFREACVPFPNRGGATPPEPAAEPAAMTPEVPPAAARDVLAERARQVSAEGWTPEHDDAYQAGDLANAAACYAVTDPVMDPGRPAPVDWPWAASWWKPTDRRRDLVKAGALILAEIERIDRAALRAGGTDG